MSLRIPVWLVSIVLIASPVFAADSTAESDNEELLRLYSEDQADRKPASGKQIDWATVGPRDAARLVRIKELYATDQLKTGADFYHAAMVLQHGDTPEDYLLAHELCVIAISKGYTRALWLAGASEDRFLRAIGRPQRFGTQYRSEGGGPTILQETDASVTDTHRRLMKVPSLAEAKARASSFDKAGSLAPVVQAPALTQDLFTATDDANTALQKLRAFAPQGPDDELRRQKGCRDLCARYSATPARYAAFTLALDHWRKLTPAQVESLAGWDPVQGENDAGLSVDERASIGQRAAYPRAVRRAQTDSIPFDEAVLDEMAALVTRHAGARSASRALVYAALNVSPEKAIPRLRELLPDDPDAKDAIRQLERIGQPCDLVLAALDGTPVRTRELRGKVVVLHFFTQRFATAVPPLKELLARHGESLALIGVASDKTRGEVERLVVEQQISWPVHHESSAADANISAQFRAGTRPYYLVLDRAGNLRYRGIQITDPAALRRIEALLRESAL